MKTGSSSSRSSNDSKGVRAIEPIPIVRPSTYLGRSPEGRDGETWQVAAIGSPRPVWLKLNSCRRQRIADLAASLVGRAIGLPIPKPVLVEVNFAHLPKESAWHGPPDVELFFGSQHAGKSPRTFSRILRDGDEQTTRALDRWDGIHACMTFDEWIANDDRHNGNLLYDPRTDGFWMIDHGRALTGDYWPIWGLDPKAETGNVLADAVRRGGTTDKLLAEIEKEANAILSDAQGVDWDSFDKAGALVRAIDPEVTAQDIRAFLVDRVELAVVMLMKKLGVRQLDLRP